MANSGSKDQVKIENLVFGGGGAMGAAYGGVIKILEQVEILSNVKRFAGTSVGSLVAAFLAMNSTVSNIEQILDTNMEYILKDYCCGSCSCNDRCCCACTCCCSCCQDCMGRTTSCFLSFCGFCNLLCGACSCREPSFGMYTGNKFLKWIGTQFEILGFPKTVTFKELYEKNCNELCIVVTNISTHIDEYCHVKTTPDMEIRQAVRISISIPVYFENIKLMNANSGRNAVYVDGGVLCNYPISCFDGWWLSMKPEDSFFTKLNDIDRMPEIYESRFKPENDEDLLKTLGFVLFADKESRLYRRHYHGEDGINKLTPVTEQPPKLDIPETDSLNGHSEGFSVLEQSPKQFIPETDIVDGNSEGFSVLEQSPKQYIPETDIVDGNSEGFSVLEQSPKQYIPETDKVDGSSKDSSATEQHTELEIKKTDTTDQVFRDINTKLKRKFLALNEATSDSENKNLITFLKFVAARNRENKLEMKDFVDELERFKGQQTDVFEDLFGDRSPTQVWTYLTQRKCGKIEFSDISRFITRNTGYSVDQWYSGFSYKLSETPTDFLGSVLKTMMLNSSRIYMKKTDIPRTVGINTKYITGLDFDLEDGDKKLLVQCGRDATVEFLKARGYKF
ncbi:uncharacterized protein LOC134236402 [Saccostrea cucullata]|uniref:uncharacterized protein LOC134236402 n=1 Tax=Saccostrea cuccullata TaxID=36930 RepID=UPI002ED45E09